MINYKLDVVTPYKDIILGIYLELKPQFDKQMNDIVPEVKEFARKTILRRLLGSRGHDLLAAGKVRGSIGLKEIEYYNAICKVMSEEVEVVVNPLKLVSNQMSGGMTVKMIESKYSKALKDVHATYKTKKGKKIPWLSWLFKGDQTAVVGYVFLPGHDFPSSRTGEGIMVRKPSSGWRVPRDIRGTPQENIFMEALEGITDDIVDFIIKRIG